METANLTEARLEQAIRDRMKALGHTSASIARELGIKQPAAHDVISRKGSKIPPSLVRLLEVLGLELTVQPSSTGAEASR